MPDSKFFCTSNSYTLRELAQVGGCTLSADSDGDIVIKSVAAINSAKPGEITFLDNPKYARFLEGCSASACIISKMPENVNGSMAFIISSNPSLSYAKIAEYLHPSDKYEEFVSDKASIGRNVDIGKGCYIEPCAVICDGAKIGQNTFIGANSYIGRNVVIGNNCVIGQSVTVSHSIVGNNVKMFPGVRVGQDGFGFATDKSTGRHVTIPQLGRVIIEDGVEIGSNTTIDRGAGPDTIIGAGTRIDNLVQIAHNVNIGKGCVVVSQVGIAGSAKLGNYVVLGGQVGVAGHLEIGDMVSVAAQSGVIKNLDGGAVYGGSPAIPVKQWHRQTAAVKKLAEKKG